MDGKTHYLVTATPKDGTKGSSVEIWADDELQAVAAACEQLGSGMWWPWQATELTWTTKVLSAEAAS